MGTLSDARGPKTEPARLYDLGRANVAAGKTQEGLPHLRSVIEHPESPADLRDSAADALISTLNRLQQYSTLESDYRRLSGRIRGRAIHSRAKHALGLWHFRSGRFPEAHAYLAGVQDPPGSDAVVEAATRTADCDYLGQRYEEALSGYTRVVRQYPQSRWAQESYYAAQLCKIKLGQTADALGGYERFLEQHPDAPQAPTVAFEAAKLYVQAEDLDAAERMLNYFEKKGPANLMEEAVRMRIAMAKRRGQHDRIVSLSRSHREAYGFNLEVAQDAAVSATLAEIPYDAFGIGARTEIAAVHKIFEDAYVGAAGGGDRPKSFSLDERFYDRGSKGVDEEHTLNCSLKRILFTPTRVILFIEARAVGFLTDASKVRIKHVSCSGENLREMPGAFITGAQLGEEFLLRHNQTRPVVLSIPRSYWSNEVKINIDIQFAKREILLYCALKGMKDG